MTAASARLCSDDGAASTRAEGVLRSQLAKLAFGFARLCVDAKELYRGIAEEAGKQKKSFQPEDAARLVDAFDKAGYPASLDSALRATAARCPEIDVGELS